MTLPAYCEVIDGPRLHGVEFDPLARFKSRMPGPADRCDAVGCTRPATAACDPCPDERSWLLYLCEHHKEVYRAHW